MKEGDSRRMSRYDASITWRDTIENGPHDTFTEHFVEKVREALGFSAVGTTSSPVSVFGAEEVERSVESISDHWIGIPRCRCLPGTLGERFLPLLPVFVVFATNVPAIREMKAKKEGRKKEGIPPGATSAPVPPGNEFQAIKTVKSLFFLRELRNVVACGADGSLQFPSFRIKILDFEVIGSIVSDGISTLPIFDNRSFLL
jgi:hypothetical protein